MKIFIKSFFYIIFSIILFITLSFVWGYTFGNTIIVENHKNLQSNQVPKSFQDAKFSVVNDIYIDNDQSNLDNTIDKVNEANSDYFILNGGLIKPEAISKFKFNDNQLINKLLEIRSHFGKYAILSSEEQANKNVKNHLLNIYKKSGFLMLTNTKRKIYFQDDKSYINLVNYEKSKVNSLKLNKNEFNLAFSNLPENILHLQNQPIQYYIYGHSLGGLVKLPFIDKLFKNYTKQYQSNLSKDTYGITQTIENAGIGTRNLKLRVWNNPQILILHLIPRT